MNKPHPKTPRGYALIFVLMVAVLLGIIVAGLFATLAESTGGGRVAHEELQQLYGCDGALRLAALEAERHIADTDLTGLQRDLASLAAALPADIDPRTGKPFADVADIRAERADAAVLTTTVDPFVGMEYTQEGTRLVVTAAGGANRGRVCRAESPNLRRSMSYFQFAVSSVDELSAPGSVSVTTGTSGSVFVVEHIGQLLRNVPSPRIAVINRTGFNVHDIRLSGGDVRSLPSPTGNPFFYIRKIKKLFGTKRVKRNRRPSAEFFVKLPTDILGPDPTGSRFVKSADLRFIDGEWFKAEPSGAFPGTQIWSDRDTSSSAPRIFSAYERDAGGDSQGGAAIIRYGLVKGSAGPNVTLKSVVGGLCSLLPDDLVEIDPTGNFTCTAAQGTETPPASGDQDPLRLAARRGFVDPEGDTAVLPIVFDMAAFIAALSTVSPGELSAHRCIGDPALCLDARRFQGSLWIGTRPGGRVDESTSEAPCTLTAAAGCVRPNAVVLYNMHDLSAFVASGKGLSIGSNLPIYVVGDVNTVRATGQPRVDHRIALLAPQITALTTDFDMTKIAWEAPTPSLPTRTTTLTWNTSIWTAWATDEGRFAVRVRNPATNALRQIEGTGVRVDVLGSMALMFTRSQYLQLSPFNRKKGGYSGGGGSYGSEPDAGVFGLPIFPGEQRFTAGNLVFPGDGTRNLRRSRVDNQPPAAPRLSIDRAPLDRR